MQTYEGYVERERWRMKIIQLVTQMEAGGAQRVAHLLNNELRLRGYDSSLWFLYTKRPAYARVPHVHSLLGQSPSLLDYFRIVIRLVRLISAEKPDVLITHTHYANVMGHVLSTLLRVRTRIAVQHNPTHTYPRMVRIVDRLIGTIGVYSRNVAVCGTVVESIASYPRTYRGRVTTVFNGAPEPASGAPRHITRRRWDIPLEATLLVNVGRFSLQKNQEFLVRLIHEDTNVHLLLVGDGELHESLHKLAVHLQVIDRVCFTGEVSQEDVSSLISASDIFVLPSRYEAASMALLEAMLLGIPVISNDIPSSREFLAEGGILVDTASPQRWLSAIRMLSDRPDIASEMATRAKARAQRFTLPRMADAYEGLIVPIEPLCSARSLDGVG
jgi:glycosyltransferase involved in cell wall biosynthesis